MLEPGPNCFFQGCTALAPMQDVTTLPFMRLVTRLGPPDLFFTEYFRVHTQSRPETHIVESIEHHGSGKPVFAQLIGEDLFHIERTVRAIEHLPIAGIDLNLGCPAPKVYKKQCGGGLLRDPDKVDAIVGLLRRVVPGLFTVKMRLGFDSTDNFPRLLEILEGHKIDALSLHARTVKGLYRSEVAYPSIGLAAKRMSCPVLGNGNIDSVEKAQWVLDTTGCRGVMIGRGAIRNPWIFRQLAEARVGRKFFRPTLADVRAYVDLLRDACGGGLDLPERLLTGRMKKFLNFVGQGVDSEGRFLHEMRRSNTEADLLKLCDRYLTADGRGEWLYASVPFDGLVARPNAEAPLAAASAN
ncbi:MAG: tRNA dihydrouridine synthase [Opitutales bacterium]